MSAQFGLDRRQLRLPLSRLSRPEDFRNLAVQIVFVPAVELGLNVLQTLGETLPFIEVLLIIEAERQRGNGARAVRDREREMRAPGFDLLLTSTQADETTQHFCRKLGSVDCGSLTVRNKPAEIFMQRKLA